MFLFLYLFEPFGIGGLGTALPRAAAGFGLVTASAMLPLNILLPLILPGWYDSDRWSTGREIVQITLNIFLIGACNVFYYSWFLDAPLTWRSFLWFQLATLLVGAFPVSVYVLINERKRRTRFEKGAAEISSAMRRTAVRAPADQQVQFTDPEGRLLLSVNVNDVLFAQSTGNYADIHFQDKETRRVTIRSTLRAIELALKNHTQFVRCHRSYIINLQRVQRISGNAQGYRLHIDGSQHTVPVSRQHGELVRQRLSSGL